MGSFHTADIFLNLSEKAKSTEIPRSGFGLEKTATRQEQKKVTKINSKRSMRRRGEAQKWRRATLSGYLWDRQIQPACVGLETTLRVTNSGFSTVTVT